MADSNQNMQQSDEITLKELILLIKEYWGVLWGKKWYIIIAGLVGGLIFGIIEYRKPVTYTAELTFMVNDNEGGGLSAQAQAIRLALCKAFSTLFQSVFLLNVSMAKSEFPKVQE